LTFAFQAKRQKGEDKNEKRFFQKLQSFIVIGNVNRIFEFRRRYQRADYADCPGAARLQ